jgi:3-hydroxybutyryl-CoA dehydrogenase
MEIKTIGIIGAGQMGGGIAQVAAQSGFTVLLSDATPELAEKGKKAIEKQLAKAVEKGKIKEEDKNAALGRIKVASSLKDFAPCQLAIEAVTENVDLKKKLFTELDSILDKEAILASNTSSISITLLGAAAKRPDKFIGMHFMNPVPVMKLVEVIRGLATGEETYKAVVALAEKMGKTTVTASDYPGFIVNRVLMPMINEACYALMEGLGTAKDIDTGMKLGCNHPMGPFELADFIGLDTCLAILEVLHAGLGSDKYRPCPLLRQYVQAGYFGRKTGKGFYRY